MSDSPQQPQSTGANAQVQPPLTLHTQYVKDLSFESPNAPAVFGEAGQQAPQLDIQLNVGARPLQQRIFEVVLDIEVTAKLPQDRTAFHVSLSYGCVVSLGPQVPEERFEGVLLVDCAAIIFPFARRVIGDATRDGGFPPVLINPVDFAGLLQQRRAQAQAAQAGAPASSIN